MAAPLSKKFDIYKSNRPSHSVDETQLHKKTIPLTTPNLFNGCSFNSNHFNMQILKKRFASSLKLELSSKKNLTQKYHYSMPQIAIEMLKEFEQEIAGENVKPLHTDLINALTFCLYQIKEGDIPILPLDIEDNSQNYTITLSIYKNLQHCYSPTIYSKVINTLVVEAYFQFTHAKNTSHAMTDKIHGLFIDFKEILTPQTKKILNLSYSEPLKISS